MKYLQSFEFAIFDRVICTDNLSSAIVLFSPNLQLTKFRKCTKIVNIVQFTVEEISIYSNRDINLQ